MEQENKELFEEIDLGENSGIVEETSGIGQQSKNIESKESMDEIDSMLEDISFGELSDGETLDVQLKQEDMDADGLSKVFQIDTAEILKPALRNADGPIPPKVFDEKSPNKKGYESKLKITYKNSAYASIIPKITWYLGVDRETGKKNLRPWFPMKGITEDKMDDPYTRTISKLYALVCKKLGVEQGKLSAKGFEDYLKSGLSVKLKQWSIIHKGEKKYRLDIAKIV